MPEGLQEYALILADIISFYGKCECIIIGEVTYGACCLQDYLCEAFGVDLIIHYAHSCIIPLNKSPLRTMYVFVEIQFDLPHFVQTIKKNFDKSKAMFMISNVQFASGLMKAKAMLKNEVILF